MAIRPLKNCEVAVGGGVSGGDGTQDGMEEDVVVRRWVAKAISVAKTHTRNTSTLDTEAIELSMAELLKLSVGLNISGRGEVLGMRVMSFLGFLFEVGRHTVSEVYSDLMEKSSDCTEEFSPFTVVRRLIKGHRILVW